MGYVFIKISIKNRVWGCIFTWSANVADVRKLALDHKPILGSLSQLFGHLSTLKKGFLGPRAISIQIKKHKRS